MPALSRLCAYCGASAGSRVEYADAARGLGEAMGRRGIGLVYGGGGAGLMGSIADGVLAQGGRVVGVITRQLVDLELAHGRVSDMRIVETMHERKRLMAELADGFVALPGGYGTLDEFFECLAWAQLGLHHRPIGLLNTVGYYNGLLGFLERAAGDGFLRLDFREAIVVDRDPDRLVERMCGLAAAGATDGGG